ncbi:MAG: RHS repeat protein [Bacteroidales bacterium]|nr:RHS repeat protein [Bacteroidales bacterium]
MKPSCDILVVEVLYDSLYDESGVMCYEYGNMGEVVAETRVYALPFLSQPIALATQFTYDSWGRIQSITYPDNEVVNYAYDLGCQLRRNSKIN